MKDKVLSHGVKKYVLVIALFIGTVVYHAISKMVDFILCKVKNMKTLRPFDEFFLYDSPGSLSNVIINLNFSKFDGETMREYLFNKSMEKTP